MPRRVINARHHPAPDLQPAAGPVQPQAPRRSPGGPAAHPAPARGAAAPVAVGTDAATRALPEQATADLTLFIAAACTILRQAARLGWLDREVIEGTRALSCLVDRWHAAAGGATISIDHGAIRHLESGSELALKSRAVAQIHRCFRRLNILTVSFQPPVNPQALRRLLCALLDPAQSLDGQLPPEGGVKVVRLSDAPVVLLGADDQETQPATARGSTDAGSPSSARPAGARPVDPLDLMAPTGSAAVGPPPSSLSGAAPRAEAARTPAAGGGQEQQLQQLRRENAAIRQAIEEMVTAGAVPLRPAILTCVDAIEQDEHLAFLLNSLRQHDRYTFDHSCNVALLAAALARELGVEEPELRAFAAAALLHDIGKLYTPLEVLNKSGAFTPDEWQAMRRHPLDGMEILEGAAYDNHYCGQVTLLHHVSYDGRGYPSPPKERPDIFAHVIQAADVYDAFTTIRPYRRQARPREVLEVLAKGNGTQFNPEVVAAMQRLMGEHPIGAVLKLDNGQLGLVIDTGRAGSGRPIVRVIQDEQGRRPARTTLLDLGARLPGRTEYLVDVVEAVDPLIRNIPIGRYV